MWADMCGLRCGVVGFGRGRGPGRKCDKGEDGESLRVGAGACLIAFLTGQGHLIMQNKV